MAPPRSLSPNCSPSSIWRPHDAMGPERMVRTPTRTGSCAATGAARSVRTIRRARAMETPLQAEQAGRVAAEDRVDLGRGEAEAVGRVLGERTHRLEILLRRAEHVVHGIVGPPQDLLDAGDVDVAPEDLAEPRPIADDHRLPARQVAVEIESGSRPCWPRSPTSADVPSGRR